MENSKKIFVSNLSYSLTEQDVDDFFGMAGQVVSSKIIRDKVSGESRGFAFIEMYNEEQAQKCVNQLNGLSIKGRVVKVNFAKPRDEHLESVAQRKLLLEVK